MNVVQKMLRDYYEMIEYDNETRPVVLENIDKVINCGDPSYGGAMYGCLHCGNLRFVPFRCHVLQVDQLHTQASCLYH